MSIERAQAIITAKQEALTARDVRDIQTELLLAPLDDQREAEGWIWEAVGLIVNDPEYKGDAAVPA